MLTEKELEAAINRILGRIDEVNRRYIKKIAAQLLKIGELNASSVNRLIVMTDMNADIKEITRDLAHATALNVRDVYQIYFAALQDSYTDPRFAAALKSKPLTPTQNERLTWMARNVATQTAQSMINLSNTTAIRQPYKDALDKAITATAMGLTSYNEAARDIIREFGSNGLKVQYESGYQRRLDSAVRQNIIDGVNQINQNASLAMGEMLGYDAVEISAHANSAPDHEPVQGRVFLLKEFEKMQNGEDFEDVDGNRYSGFRRPIGEWNCMHIAMSFSTEHSIRRYDDATLKKWQQDNAKGCTINGKHYSLYQARQLMRQLETKVRQQKDAANTARENGNDMEERRACQKRINALTKQYYAAAKASGLSPRSDRLSVEGFRMVKV